MVVPRRVSLFLYLSGPLWLENECLEHTSLSPERDKVKSEVLNVSLKGQERELLSIQSLVSEYECLCRTRHPVVHVNSAQLKPFLVLSSSEKELVLLARMDCLT